MSQKIKEAPRANKSPITGYFACPHINRPMIFSELMSQYFKLSSEQLLRRHARQGGVFCFVLFFLFTFALSDIEDVVQEK